MSEIGLEEALKDVEFFFSTLESGHPQLLAHVTGRGYLDLKDRVRKQITKAARKGLVLVVEFTLIMAKAASFFGDGHTAIFLDSGMVDKNDPTRRMLPFWMEYRTGKIYIGHTVAGLRHLEGCRLLQIGGRDAFRAIEPMVSRISGERLEARIAMFAEWQRTYWALCYRPRTRKIEIAYLNDEGNEHREKVSLLSIQEYDSEVITAELRESWKQRKIVEFYDQDRICYLRYDVFRYKASEKRFFRSFFKNLARRASKDLVVDLRWNRGGSSNIMEYILDYLTTEPYRGTSRMDVKLSQTLFDQRDSYGKRYRQLEGLIVTHKIDPVRPRDRGYRFKGRLFLITGPQTFSTASMFALIVKDHRMGTILGEETGGVRESFGDTLKASMPNSKIGFTLSHKHFFAPTPQSDDRARGVVPDIPLQEGDLRRFRGTADPTKAWAMQVVREGG